MTHTEKHSPSDTALFEQWCEKWKNILAEEFADADKRNSNPGYWGETGRAVQNAANSAQYLMNHHLNAYENDWQKKLSDFESILKNYIDHYDDDMDEDGYGKSTLHGIMRAFRANASKYTALSGRND